VEGLVASNLDDVESLVRQGLGPLAAEIVEEQGKSVPPLLLREQRSARASALTASLLLERVRDACAGPVLILKGPELAARYPNHSRLYGDLDILVTDAAETQRGLIAAGFVELDDPEGLWVDIHHLPRLSWPNLPLHIEVHSRPKWLEGSSPPRIEELFAEAVPARSGAPGLLAPSPMHHAILVAAHSWGHQPLGRLRDLIDVGALASETDRWELDDQAKRWGVARLWTTSVASLEAILAGQRTVPLRLWAGHIAVPRDQTVFEHHVERVLSPFWGLPFTSAARCSVRAFGNEFRPAFDETWPEKLRRTTQAVRRARVAVSAHNRLLGAAALRGRRRNRAVPEGEDNGSSRDSP
jgi:hypothetical protein